MVDSGLAAVGPLPVQPGKSSTISNNALISVLQDAFTVGLVQGQPASVGCLSQLELSASAPQVVDSGSAVSGAVVGLPELIAGLRAFVAALGLGPCVSSASGDRMGAGETHSFVH